MCPETNCKSKFATKYNLNLHMLRHKQDFKHICAQCGKGFMNRNHLETHQNAHMEVKPFECYKCHKGFCSKSALKQHQASCTIISKEHECCIRGKMFLTSENLRRHQKRVHISQTVKVS